MKIKQILGVFLLMLFIGCASNQALVDSSIQQAESLKTTAVANKASTVKISLADEKLKEAKKQNEAGKTEEALLAAEESLLQYRLVLAQSSLDGLNNDYELLEKEVQAAESYKNELKSKLEQIRKEK
jgi:uncharacterized membrane protein YcgQ (UPF0703/DUF1980 family)